MVTVAERDGLDDAIDAMVYDVWPRYVTEGTTRGYSDYIPDWYGMFRRWPHLQFGLFAEDGEMVACGNACLCVGWRPRFSPGYRLGLGDGSGSRGL
ncbi:MAG: hypothetical protein R2873_08120 [Caldilineaceae bacterium]